ncbi:MAG TPA: M20 family metallopeptidase [Streptosporangiaceae bacterium]|jgi:hippurate hydrolase|nr:M20 family metallopeptidase [Streptosporangiaceae bacterium]
MAVTEDATAIAGELTHLRRAIHAEPEVGLQLPLTQQKILAALDGLPLEVTLGSALTSVTAVLRGGGGDGPAVLLRADMDALPVSERTGLDFASRLDGTMHACGHDLHSAMLVGAARLLSARQAELPGSVVFMFQPGEEGHGGAAFMIEEGVLDAAGQRAAAAYALHVASAELPFGVFSSRPGPMMAAAEALEITVTGRGGHGSQPHHAADPIPVACEIVTALQVLVTRRFDIFDPVVITVGSFHAGTTNNVIPDEARLEVTIRSFSPQARALVRESAVRLVHEIAAAHGLTATAEFTGSYPVTVNDNGEEQFAAGVVADFLGEDRYHPQANPMAGAEDFSYVLEQVPGAFVMLGACPPGVDPATAPFNHSALAVFDDMVLADGAALFTELTVRRLTR